jgi:hypothetical protein
MPAVVSAGVYIQEKDDSLYAPAISPTIIGIVGTATKGLEDVAVLVTNEGQLIEEFGKPRTKDFGLQAAIEALKAGRLVFYIRISGASAAAGSIDIDDTGSGATAASIGPSQAETFNLVGGSTESPTGTRETIIRFNYDIGGGPVSDADATFTALQAAITSGNAETYDLNAIAAGAATTLLVRVNTGPIQTITFASTDPLITAYAAVTAAEAIAVINDQIIGGESRITGTSVIVASDRFGSGSTIQITGGTANDLTDGFNFSTSAVTGSGDVSDLAAVTGAEVKTLVEADIPDLAVTVGLNGDVTFETTTTGSTRTIEIESVLSTAIGAAPLINVTPLDSTETGTDATAASPTVRFTASSNGSWSGRLKVRTTASAVLAGTVKVEILLDDFVVETYDRLFKSPTPVVGGLDLITAINTGDTATNVLASEFVVASELNASGENPEAGTVTLAAGDDGDDWTPGDVVGTVIGPVSTGLQIFASPDNIFINVMATPGISYAAVISAAITICEGRGDCLAIVDCPQDLTPAEVVDWHNGINSSLVVVDQELRTEVNTTTFNSSYAALYWPFVKVFDKFNPTEGADADGQIFIPPSGLMLRTIAHTDNVAEPWFAPAGPNRTQSSSVLDLAANPTLGERDLMQIQGNNVNPIANINGVGVVIMGQKTLQRAPTALDRVNVRRLLLAIEKVISQSVFFLMFEQNDSVMWRRFINLVTPVMEDVKARRGVFDFRVIADSSTTTDLLIDQNTFVGKIFLKPTKTAEKLIIPFNLVPTGANFEEFAQA